MTDTTDKTRNMRIRILPEQWARVEKAASGTMHNPNELLVQLAMEGKRYERGTLTFRESRG